MWKRKTEIAMLAAVVALSWGCASARSHAADPDWVLGPPTEVHQGGIADLRIAGSGLASVEGSFSDERVFFHEEAGDFTALLGIDLQAKPGSSNVLIEAITMDGKRRAGRIPLTIAARSFPEESFNVPAAFDQFPPAVLERIRMEREQFAAAFADAKPQRFWRAPFIAPVTADISSPFGYRRTINGKPRAPHTGVDLRAPAGTEVLAANDARVLLTGDFFFNGKSVVLDHGGGVFTMYFHLSEIKAQRGALVRKGDVIALSGMTGRVTGPHLHWGARLNGARVDPVELVGKGSAGRAVSTRAVATNLPGEAQNGN